MVQATTKFAAKSWVGLTHLVTNASTVHDFHQRVLDLQCKIVAAEYGVLWIIDQQGQPVLDCAWPESLKNTSEQDPVRAILNSAVDLATKQQSNLVMRVDQEGINTSPGLGAHVFATIMRIQGKVAAITTVVADCRDPGVIQRTSPMRDLSAGLYEVFAARQEADYRTAEATRVRKSMAILATSQEAEGFYGASLNLINEMARQLRCSRVSLGWIKGKNIKLVAMSDTENLKRHSQDVAQIELAMAECLDQQQPVVYPIPPDAEPMLAHAITHAHRELTAGKPNQHTISVPIRLRDEWIGVLTFERQDGPPTDDLIQHLQMIADVVASHLWDRYDNDRWLVGHAYQSFKKICGYLVGPKHVMWKLGSILGLVCLIYLAFGTWTYKVGAPFAYESQVKRILPAPFDAQIAEVYVQPGDPVKKDQILAKLDVRELELQLADAHSRQRMAQLKRSKGRAEGKTADAQLAQAELDQVEAQIKLLEYRINTASIRAPFDGYVVSGAWQDKVGSTVQLGDNLYEVAPASDMLAVLHVQESDINLIQPGQTGTLASKADPQYKIEFTIQRIVPMATPFENQNTFEVRAHIEPVQHRLLAGTEGQAYITIGTRPIRWIATRKIMNKIHLWFWW